MNKLLVVLLATFATGAVHAAASDCEKAPTRRCALEMAGDAIAEGTASQDNASYQEAWQAWSTVINTAAKLGETDLALSLANKADKNFSRLDIGDLAAALKLAGREAEAEEAFDKFLEDWPSYDGRVGPALIASGKTSEFDSLFTDRDYSPETLAEMKAAGLLMAGRTDDAISALKALEEDEQSYVAVNVLSTLRTEQRLDAAAPLLPFYDLKAADGAAYCAMIASATADAAQTGKCFDAFAALPPEATQDGFYASVAAPEMIGALATAGDWQKAQALALSLPEEGQKMAFAKIAQVSRSPELVPALQQAFAGDSPLFPKKERGEYLVRLLVMADMEPKAAELIAAAPDEAAKDDWTRWQAEAITQKGRPADAFQTALTIKAPAIRAHALAVIAASLPD